MNQNIIEDNYKCVISIGIRCHTEIFLKKLGLKQFSCVFDAMYNTNVINIINILENKFKYHDNIFIYTENIDNSLIKTLNNKHGCRTIHKFINYNKNNLVYSYHNALLPHHNLNNNEVKEHFNRCFNRLDKIQNYKIKTLFCLFIHPEYSGDSDISIEDINILKNYLLEHFNCNLLVCKFKKNTQNYEWNIIVNKNNLVYIHINNSSHIFEHNEKVLNEIFNYLKIEKSKLISYNEMENI